MKNVGVRMIARMAKPADRGYKITQLPATAAPEFGFFHRALAAFRLSPRQKQIFHR